MKRVILTLLLILVMPFSVMADTANELLQGNQDVVILGSVKDIRDEVITITVDHYLGSAETDLRGTDIDVSEFTYTYCEKHSTADFRSPIISDNIVIALNKSEEGTYVPANIAYKVDSTEYANCKIVVLGGAEEDCVNDLLSITCYIRSNGMVNEFDFDSEGRIYAVYPQSAEQCLATVDSKGHSVADEEIPDALPTTPSPAPAQNNTPPRDYTLYTIIIMIGGTLLGVLVSYAAFVRKDRKKS